MAMKKTKSEKGKTPKPTQAAAVKTLLKKSCTGKQKASPGIGSSVGALVARVKAYFTPGESAEA